jgi:hypothetical protein
MTIDPKKRLQLREERREKEKVERVAKATGKRKCFSIILVFFSFFESRSGQQRQARSTTLTLTVACSGKLYL